MRFFFIVFILSLGIIVSAQEHTRKDSLRGSLTSLRTCYDVIFYDLFLVIDDQNRIDRMIENLEKDLRQSDEDLHKDCVDRINGVISSTDRRFDKAYNEIHKLDQIVNPNKDLVK